MSKTLRLQTNIISLEADSGAVALQQAMTRLPGLFNEASSAFTKHIGAPLSQLFAKRDFNWVTSKVQGLNYADIRKQEIFVPPGMISNYRTYVADLEAACALASNIRKDVLEPFNRWLGEKIASPAQLKSLSAKISIDGMRSEDIEAMTKRLAKNFTTTGRQDTAVPYGMAIERSSDWTAVAEHSEKINAYFSEEQHKLVLKSKDEMQERLDVLVNRLQENPEEYQMSPAALKALATTTYEVAAAMEFYALMRYKVQELNVALRDSEGRMKQWL